jgi:hypothetical protein
VKEAVDAKVAELPSKDGGEKGAEVVSLDKFRKK